jgi:prepilin-type N-terminal cleavage/methylation domain-containing protein
MKKIVRGKKGFTLIEVMISVAIMGIASIGVMRMYKDGLRAFDIGSKKVAITSEANISMAEITRFIQVCQGSTIRITRFNSSQPANSYFTAAANETVFATTTKQNCGCGTSSSPSTYGAAFNYKKPTSVFQYNNCLLATMPVIAPGTDYSDLDNVDAHTSLQTVTLTANLDNLSFTFENTTEGDLVIVSLRLRKGAWNNSSFVTTSLRKSILVKRMHSTGYYVQ